MTKRISALLLLVVSVALGQNVSGGGTGTAGACGSPNCTVSGNLTVSGTTTMGATVSIDPAVGITLTGSKKFIGDGSLLTNLPVSMVYPGAGIANSTGSAWATSYTTSGSGTVIALATSPAFTTPNIGAASGTSITLSSLTIGRLTYAGTAGLLTDNANFKIDTATANSLLVPNGTNPDPAIVFGSSGFHGNGLFYDNSRGFLTSVFATNASFAIGANATQLAAANVYAWSSNSDPGGNRDTGVCRNAAGVVEFNNGTCGTFREVKYRHTLSNGTSPTIASGFAASGSTIAGFDESGRITVGSTTPGSTGTITFGTAYGTAPSCVANNETTAMAVQTVATTTTLTVNGLSLALGTALNFTAADKINWRCGGY